MLFKSKLFVLRRCRITQLWWCRTSLLKCTITVFSAYFSSTQFTTIKQLTVQAMQSTPGSAEWITGLHGRGCCSWHAGQYINCMHAHARYDYERTTTLGYNVSVKNIVQGPDFCSCCLCSVAWTDAMTQRYCAPVKASSTPVRPTGFTADGFIPRRRRK